MLFTNPNMTVDDMMKAAEFTKQEIARHGNRQSVSKKKNRLIQATYTGIAPKERRGRIQLREGGLIKRPLELLQTSIFQKNRIALQVR